MKRLLLRTLFLFSIVIAGMASRCAPPVVNLGNDTTICSNATITLDAGNPGATYLWNTGETTRTIVADFYGEYFVEVNVAGEIGKDTILINMTPSTNVYFDWTVAGTCLPQPVQFNDLTTVCGNSIISWSWNFGDGQTSTSQNPVHTYSSNGTYTVTLTVNTTTDGSVGISRSVVIGANAPPAINLPPTLDVCDEGLPATLDAGNPGSAFEWSTGETTQTIDVYFPDQIWIKVTNSNGCEATDTINVNFIQPIKANFGYTATGSCLPQIVQFHDSTTTCSASPMTYLWTFGDGNTSTATEPSHIYTSAGTYVVKLKVSNANGFVIQKSKPVTITAVAPPVVNLPSTLTVCDEGNPGTLDAQNPGSTFEWSTGETTQTIDVFFTDSFWVKVTNSSGCTTADTAFVDFIQPIKPNFGYTPAGSCLPQTVQFHDSTTTCSASAMSYLWDFGDGTTSTQPEPSHVYTSAGTFVVKLRVTNDNGALVQKSKPLNITAVFPPVVNLGSDTTICKGSAILLDAANAGLSYLWSTGATSQTIPAGAGTYDVQVINAPGCIGKDTIVISDTSYITVNFNDVHTGLCIPATVGFSDNSSICGTASAEWAWDFGDGSTGTAQNPSHDYASNGAYVVKLDIKDTNGITYTYSRSVVVNNIAMPVVGLGVDTLACGNLILDAGNPGMTYAWNTGETTQQVEILGSGVYDVTVTNAAGCSKSDTIDVIIQPNVVTGFTYQVSGHCNNTVQFIDTSVICSSITVSSWQWSFGDGATSNQQHPAHTYNANGTFVVKLTIYDNVGGVTSRTKAVVIQGPAPVVDFGADIDLCPGDSTVLNAENIEATYKWTPSSLADSATAVVTLKPSADQWVAVTITGCFQSASDSILIHVRSNPKPTIAKGPSILESASSAAAYQWYFDGAAIATSTGKSHSPKAAGYYQVETFNAYGCPNISDSVFFLPSGKFKAEDIVVKVSPNPSRGRFTIYLSTLPSKPIRAEIFTAEGRLLHSEKIHSNVNPIDPGSIRKGYYIVRLTINGKFVVIPVTVL